MASQFNALRACKTETRERQATTDAESIERLLTADSNRPAGRNWPRLDNTERVQLLRDFAITYAHENELGAGAIVTLTEFLEESIRRKRLVKVKEIAYDKELGRVTGIPGLCRDEGTGLFRIVRPKSKKTEKG